MALTADDIEQAKLDPASVFAKPADVLQSQDLSNEEKLTILKRWEMDADALLRGGDEGMAEDASSGELVQDVRKAIDALES